ncbi:hypothetical protein [Aeriscardovia aeriphila]|uniref:hypothetical protein n=1 Tax=Aeriscardovia aeriphila TaxID=218139 RepID=UPI000B9AA34F|nr:hypothetical protein [Aeriscardovia aeriphila]NYI25610.1 hypothetical protein [Aeriscardovia aeriphila]
MVTKEGRRRWVIAHIFVLVISVVIIQKSSIRSDAATGIDRKSSVTADGMREKSQKLATAHRVGTRKSVKMTVAQ